MRTWSTWLIAVCDSIASTTGAASEMIRLPSFVSTARFMRALCVADDTVRYKVANRVSDGKRARSAS